jgi:rod shape determining protein RodA
VLYSAAGGSLTPWALKQGIRFVILLGFMLALAMIRPETWMRLAWPIYGVVLLGLIGVELLGQVSGGSQRWLDIGVIRLQPSEFMKLAIVLVLARYYQSLPRGFETRLNALLPALALIAFPAALVMLQPDLGTALAITFGGVVVMFLAGVRLWLFIGAGVAGAAAMPLVWSMMHEYQRKRVLIFLDPSTDPRGAGYHITQSKIAIGSGGLTGKGFLNGTQSHLDYLPELHTDFIFATMAEEWGLLGGIFIILGFAIILAWGVRVALNGKTQFERLLALGLTATLFFYLAINMMMVMGLAPVVGIPLPLISYGGSAMMTVLILLGIIMGIARANATPVS